MMIIYSGNRVSLVVSRMSDEDGDATISRLILHYGVGGGEREREREKRRASGVKSIPFSPAIFTGRARRYRSIPAVDEIGAEITLIVLCPLRAASLAGAFLPGLPRLPQETFARARKKGAPRARPVLSSFLFRPCRCSRMCWIGDGRQ